MSSNYFKNKNIIISGASRGIGLFLSEHFSNKGANLILLSRKSNQTKIALDKILKKKTNSNQNINFFFVDISKKKDVDNFFNTISKKKIRIHFLINCAGIYGPIGKFENLNWNEFKKTIDINLLGSIYFIKKLIPIFKKNNFGKIIQLSGGGATAPFPNFMPYSISKVGLVRFIENISEELEDYKIYVNTIAPGAVNTRMLSQVLKAGPRNVGKKFYNKSNKQKKHGGADLNKIADCVDFLLNKSGNGISGKLISVIWDNWKLFNNNIKNLKRSDVGTLRRITGRDRRLRFFDND